MIRTGIKNLEQTPSNVPASEPVRVCACAKVAEKVV